MNARTERRTLMGPAGALECLVDHPAADAMPLGSASSSPTPLAVICHPHPVHGGTMDNKVVQTLARAFVQRGCRTVRFNFRGVGQSQGQWDEGRGEVDDAKAVIEAFHEPGIPWYLAGFSFGTYVASQVAAQMPPAHRPRRMVLVGPAVQKFALADVPQDTLVIHGEADEVIPLSHVLDWARPRVKPVTVIPATGHFFHGQLLLLKSLVLDALHSHD